MLRLSRRLQLQAGMLQHPKPCSAHGWKAQAAISVHTATPTHVLFRQVAALKQLVQDAKRGVMLTSRHDGE